MKKYLLVLSICTSLITLSGCNVDEEKKNEAKPTNKEVVEKNKDVSKAPEPTSKESEKPKEKEKTMEKETMLKETKVSSKRQYTEKLKDTKEKADKLQSKYDSGVTLDMNNASSEEYELWDDLLNQIYITLKKEMQSDKFEGLKAEQIKWIEYKEARAKAEYEKYDGGSLATVSSNITKANITKDRCYELVDKYMN
ncbi:MAG: lysozyme inhibitor LprI family protein [Clostridium sp.]